MSGRKTDAFYQPPGTDEWQKIESAEVRARPQTKRERARALLAKADAAVEELFREKEKLSPEEELERDLARAIGAWGRYFEIEARRIGRMAESAFESRFGKKSK